ncbi:MAG TPA: hypothetical protein ENO21_04280, partial [Firmicutes bacterium]|nr:hypothetical protein [Bacillota bacterium]
MRTDRNHPWYLALFCLACLGFAACNGDGPGSTPSDLEGPSVEDNTAFTQVPFPVDEAMPKPKAGSGIAANPIDAVDSYDESDNTSENGTFRVLAAGPGEISWAMYQFDSLQDWCDLTNLGMEFDVLPETYYLGLADFEAMQWYWLKRGTSTGGEDALDVFHIPDGFDGISPAGNLYAVALFYDDAGGTLQQAILSWQTSHNGPEAYFEADPDKGNASLQVFFDASGTLDKDAVGIANYEWDWEGDGVYDESGPDSTVDHTYTTVGEYHPVVRATDEDDGLTDTAQLTIRVQGWRHSFGSDGGEIVEGVTYQGDNIFLVGQVTLSGEGGPDTEALLLSYDSAGNPRWQKSWGGGPGHETFLACAGSSSNGFVAVGQGENFDSSSLGIHVVRFDGNGNQLWARHWDTPGTDIASGVAVDLAGNTIVAGHTDGFDLDIVYDGVVLKYSPSGELLWEKSLVNDSQTTCRDVDIALNGHIYVAADTNLYDPNCATVFHLDADGKLVKESPLDIGVGTRINGITVSIFGEVYITGHVSGADQMMLIAALNSDGNYTWARAWDYGEASLGRDI